MRVKKSRCWIRAGVLCALAHTAHVAMGIGIHGQRIVAEATVAALPEGLREFLESRLEGIIERTIEPDTAWREDARNRSRADWHHLALDAAAADQGWPERLLAAQSFPNQQNLARRVFSTHNVKDGGQLPWQLAKLVDDLAGAIRTGDDDAIVRFSGYVIHFAADAANPFAATCDRRAEAAGNAVFATVPMGDRMFAHQDAAQRIGWELLRRNAERYHDALEPESIRFEIDVSDVPFATIVCMARSYAHLEELCNADREIMARMALLDDTPANAEAFLARADEFYPLLDARCGDSCVELLRRAVGLASTLIVTAWTRAGSPNPICPPTTPAADSPALAAAPPSASQDAAAPGQEVAQTAPQVADSTFVASRKAKVYHRGGCGHVKRIAETNRVVYQSEAEAQGAGKRPCRTCQPDASAGAGTARQDGDASKNR